VGVLKRRDEASDEDLRKQLLAVPEVGLDQTAAALLYRSLPGSERRGRSSPSLAPPSLEPDLGRRFLVAWARDQYKQERTFLPWRKIPDCQLGKESADRLHVLSLSLRASLRASVPPGDVRPDPDRLRALLLGADAARRVRTVGTRAPRVKPSEWQQPGAVPALVQLLQHENTPIRLLLVELLSEIDGKEAGLALAERALFDLSPQVREKAVQALAQRPREESRKALVGGFRHPWPPVAEHSAEALVALRDREALPALVELLTEPDPTLPFVVKDKGPKELVRKRELVRVNHMSNCMLCHAASLSREDVVRGRIPIPGEEPPPLYYAETTGHFVRADTTFLRQEFSVVQPVADPGKWPGNQRFDYLVRTRPLKPAERVSYEQRQKTAPPPDHFEQREALLFSLKELTGKDPGRSYEDWKPLLKATREGAKEESPRGGD
jgi:hypothetical protein